MTKAITLDHSGVDRSGFAPDSLFASLSAERRATNVQVPRVYRPQVGCQIRESTPGIPAVWGSWLMEPPTQLDSRHAT